jgi:hypothetical protein
MYGLSCAARAEGKAMATIKRQKKRKWDTGLFATNLQQV